MKSACQVLTLLKCAAIPGMDLAEAARLVPDGAVVGISQPGPLGLIQELIRQGRRGLHLVTVPTGGRAAELLIAAGCVSVIETSAVDLGEEGQAPAFGRAVVEGSIKVLDWTCPALLMALQAGAAGVSFTPVPGLLDSDLLKVRSDFREIDDPYRPGARTVLVPALAPDFALVRVRRADPAGNAVIGIGRDDRLLIRSAGVVIAEAEQIEPGPIKNLAADEQLIPAAYLDAIVLEPAPAVTG